MTQEEAEQKREARLKEVFRVMRKETDDAFARYLKTEKQIAAKAKKAVADAWADFWKDGGRP